MALLSGSGSQRDVVRKEVGAPTTKSAPARPISLTIRRCWAVRVAEEQGQQGEPAQCLAEARVMTVLRTVRGIVVGVLPYIADPSRCGPRCLWLEIHPWPAPSGAAQFSLRKHPDGRVAGQQAAGLDAVTLELGRTLDRGERAGNGVNVHAHAQLCETAAEATREPPP